MVGVEVTAEVDRLAERLHRSVVLDDPQVRPLLTTRHYGDEDAVRVRAVLQRDPGAEVSAHVLAQGVASWRTPGRVAAREDLGLAARWCAPVRHDDELLGLLLVIDADGSLDAEQREDVRRVAERLGPLLATAAEHGDRARRAEAVLVLLGRAEGDRDRAAAVLGTEPEVPARVLVAGVSAGRTDRESVGAVLARGLTSVDLPLHALDDGLGWVLVTGPDAEDDARAGAARLRDELAVLLPGGRPVVGSGATAAADLHVHRTSLYYRLSRIEALTGLDLADGRHRLWLHQGLLVRRLLRQREENAAGGLGSRRW